MVKRRQQEAFQVLVLEDEVGVEPDLFNGGNEGIEEGGAEVDEGVGGDEGGGERRFVVGAVILAFFLKMPNNLA